MPSKLTLRFLYVFFWVIEFFVTGYDNFLLVTMGGDKGPFPSESFIPMFPLPLLLIFFNFIGGLLLLGAMGVAVDPFLFVLSMLMGVQVELVEVLTIWSGNGPCPLKSLFRMVALSMLMGVQVELMLVLTMGGRH